MKNIHTWNNPKSPLSMFKPLFIIEKGTKIFSYTFKKEYVFPKEERGK